MLVCALAGGVGAAKFLRGLVAAADPKEITVIGNTGDDAVLHGLHISPDLDIVMYTLAGIAEANQGWGIESDSTAALDQMRSYGVDAWFKLTDRDIGTHMARTTWLSEGLSLSGVTDRLRTALGIEVSIVPMSDQPVRTKLTTRDGRRLDFQEYFVRLKHSDLIARVDFEGSEKASAAPGVLEAIEAAELIIVCPSNPIVSIGPILSVPGIRHCLAARRERVMAISPIVQGAPLRGPADKLLVAAGVQPSACGVASLYADFCGTMVIDRRDQELAAEIHKLNMKTVCLETIMNTPQVARQLAVEVLKL